jgi:pyruvate kinase
MKKAMSALVVATAWLLGRYPHEAVKLMARLNCNKERQVNWITKITRKDRA